jgi:chromosome segregation ATPase
MTADEFDRPSYACPMTEHSPPDPAEEPSLESRLSAVEEDLARVRYQANLAAADAAAARILAAGADHDVSEVRAELRAHTRALSALRESQRAMQQELVAHRTEFAAVRSEMASGFRTVDARLQTVDARLETVDARLETVDARLETVDGQLQTVDAQLETVDARLQTVGAGITHLTTMLETLIERG